MGVVTSVSSAISSVDSNHFVSVDIDLLEGDLVASFDVSEKILFSAGYEHDCLTFRTRSTGTTDSVNIRLWILWYIVVDYERDVLHVESSRRDIGGDEDVTEAILKSLEGSSTISLLHISMETSGRESISFEHISDVLCFVFHSAEYHDFGVFVFLDVFLEHIVFLEVRNLDKGVIDLRNHELFCRLDGFVSVPDVFREEIIHFLWNSRGECHRLLHSSETGPYHIDIIDKSHVEHSIHLIENEILYV